MKIGIANDHSGVELKNELKKYIEEEFNYEVINYGTDSSESIDYPLLGETLAKAVIDDEVDLGIAICGTGIGISLACNKVKGIRCGACSEPYSAGMARRHNNCNILALGSRVVGFELAKMMVKEFLSAEFEGGRHSRRVNMIMELEEE